MFAKVFRSSCFIDRTDLLYSQDAHVKTTTLITMESSEISGKNANAGIGISSWSIIQVY